MKLKTNCKLKRKWIFVLLVIGFAAVLSIATVAMSDQEAMKIIRNYPFEQVNPMTYCLRSLLFIVCVGLSDIVCELEKVIYTISDVMGKLLQSSEVQQCISLLRGLVLVCFVILLAVIGLQFMIKGAARAEIVQNLLVGIIVIIGIPTMMAQGYDATVHAMDYVQKSSEHSLGEGVLAGGIIDNYSFANDDFQHSKYKDIPEASKAKIDYPKSINPTEDINPDNLDDNDKKVFGNMIETSPSTGDKLVAVHDCNMLGFDFPMFSNRYYRYSIDFLTIILVALILIVALIFTSIKIARLLFELIVHQALADILALLDIQSGQRLKKCLQSILATFATLFGCMFLMRLYIIGAEFLKVQLSDNPWVYIICMLAISWALIDGPNIIEQIVGVDAGLHSAVRTLYGIQAAGRMVSGAARMGKNAVNKVKGAATGAASAAGKGIAAFEGITKGDQDGINMRKASKASMPGMAKPSANQKSSDSGAVSKTPAGQTDAMDNKNRSMSNTSGSSASNPNPTAKSASPKPIPGMKPASEAKSPEGAANAASDTQTSDPQTLHPIKDSISNSNFAQGIKKSYRNAYSIGYAHQYNKMIKKQNKNNK